MSVKEIADAVDVSVPTLFNHVPEGKEALIFDDGAERRESLLAALRDRAEGRTVMDALREFLSGRGPFVANPDAAFRRRTELIMTRLRCAAIPASSGSDAKSRWPQRSPPTWVDRPTI